MKSIEKTSRSSSTTKADFNPIQRKIEDNENEILNHPLKTCSSFSKLRNILACMFLDLSEMQDQWMK